MKHCTLDTSDIEGTDIFRTLLDLEIGCPVTTQKQKQLFGSVRRAISQLLLQQEVELRHVRQCAFEDALEHDAYLALLQRKGLLESGTDAIERVKKLLHEVTVSTPLSGGLSAAAGEDFLWAVNAACEPLTENIGETLRSVVDKHSSA